MSTLFLAYGDDDLSAARAAQGKVDVLCPLEDQAFALETFAVEPGAKDAESAVQVVGAVREAVATPSMLGGEKTVFLKGANFLSPKKEPGKFAAVKEAVERLTGDLKKGLPDGVNLVVLATDCDRSTSFYKTCAKVGEVAAFAVPERAKDVKAEFFPLVRDAIAGRGLKMAPDALDALLERTGYALRLVESELDKLALYVMPKTEITREDVVSMVSSQRVHQFWEYADAFCTGNLAETLQCLEKLFRQRVFPVPLVVNLQNRIRQLLLFRDAMDRGLAKLSGGERFRTLTWEIRAGSEEAELMEALGAERPDKVMPPFRAATLAAQAVKFPAGRWMRWLAESVQAQMEMTGDSRLPPETILELFTIRALSPLSRRA